MSQPELPALYLKRNEDRRLRAGHLWVFSNEVDVARSPLPAFTPGEAVWILDHAGKPLGTGYVNPNSLICARLVDRSGHALDRSLITHRLKVALGLRDRLYPEGHYRAVFGESDGLPGLTVERYGDVVVAQSTTAGMAALEAEVEAAIEKVLKPRVLLWKNDSGARDMEGLDSHVRLAWGELDGPVEVIEDGVRFLVDLVDGQKTGFFFDQRGNRARMAPYVKGARVLDLFSYVGAWGLRALAQGAAHATCVDASALAVGSARASAAANGVGADRFEAVQADVFDFLKAARAQRQRWDVVIIDPPAFVKRRKDLKEGALAYRRLAELGMQVLERDGLLVSCSCSHHLPKAMLVDGVQAAARQTDRFAQLLEHFQQAPDHPMHPAIPETEYLKGVLCRVLPA
jgi:23S rRNA (cytosine1962-C5)-methyltransferase